jgi:hypothetical protein
MAKITVVKEKDTPTSEIGRKFKQSPGLYIGSVFILVLVTVAFVGGDFLGIGGGYRGGDLTFGYYDKVPISFVPGNMFSQYRDNARMNLQARGFDISSFQVDYEIWRQAYEGAIVHTAILQMMKRSGYNAPEKTVDKNVAQLPQFQENGRFSAALYNQTSEARRLTLWREVQDELNKSMFYGDYFYGLLVPSGEAEFISKMGAVKRNFDVVSFNVDDYPEAEYLSYAAENERLFSSIHLSKITVNSSEREARKIIDSIKDGTTTFEDAARAQSIDTYADRGGDMGLRYYYEMDREIYDAAQRDTVVSLPRGELSDIIRVDNSWVIFRVEDALKPADFADDTVMERVRLYVKDWDRGRMEEWAFGKANDFIELAKTSGFDMAVRFSYLQKSSFGPLSINFGGIDLFDALEASAITGLTEQDLKDLSSNENFWKTAFGTPLYTPSEPLVQGNKVLVFLPTEQIETDEEALEGIANSYKDYWLTRITEESVQYYFRNHPKMDDRFIDTYLEYLAPR